MSKKNAGKSKKDNTNNNGANNCQDNMKYSENKNSGSMTDCSKNSASDKNETNCR